VSASIALFALLGCPKAPPGVSADPASQVGAGATPLHGDAPASQLKRAWESPVAAAHPLVGWVYDPLHGTYAEWDAMIADLRTARYVFLGEKHDNLDHHRLQAEVITALRPGAVVFEQLDLDDPVAPGLTPDALAAAVKWDDSGWPPFDAYRPVFEALTASGAKVVAGHPNRPWVKQVMESGWSSLPEEARAGLADQPALPTHLQEHLAQEIVASHCGMATPALVEKMTRAQLLKDTTLARAMREHAPADGAAPTVLVAGNGHARGDRGVPFWLDGARRSVSFVEVSDEAYDPAPYVEGADWVVFTPRVDDEDPCAAFRKGG
jgi:uncharacterized iron-regulated protein